MNRIAALTMVGLALVSSMAACSGSTPHVRRAPLRVLGSSTTSVTVQNVPELKPYVFALLSVCVTKHPVTVTGVTVNHPRGSMKILDWAGRVRFDGDTYSTGNNDPGAAPGDLARIEGFNHRPFSVRCSDQSRAIEFDVNIETTSPARAYSQGFWIHYRSDGTTGMLLDPSELKICPSGCRSTPLVPINPNNSGS
jgi:hypothetical protein